MNIRRFPYPGLGRCEAVSSNGVVYAVATDPQLAPEFGGQVRNCLEELERVLLKADSGKPGLLQVTVYLADVRQKPKLDEIWIDWIGDETNWPQRACVGVDLDAGCQIEIIATAACL